MKQTQLHEVRELWKLCFNDSEEFIELYFSMRYTDEINKTISDNERMISAMQLLPYPMTYCGTSIPTSYISGACTHPDYRKHGAMKRLMRKSFIHMYDNGTLLCNLIPAEEWLFNYYERFDFAPVFDYTLEETDVNLLPETSGKYQIAPYSPYQLDVHSYLDRKMKGRSCCIQHSMDDFNVIMADLKLSHGKLLVARIQMEIVGIAFCVSGDNATYITELFAETPEVRYALLKEAALQMGNHQLRCILPPKENKEKHLGMARIINAEKMLQLFCKKYNEIGISIELTDNLITENSDYYTLKHGTCERGFHPDRKYHKLNIKQLTYLLLGYGIEDFPKEFQVFPSQQPYMSLMLN